MRGRATYAAWIAGALSTIAGLCGHMTESTVMLATLLLIYGLAPDDGR